MIKVKGIENKLVENWSKTYSCRPELYFEPRNLDEIRQILIQAKENGKKVRAMGCGVSPSQISYTKDYLICMKNFNKIIDVKFFFL